MGAWIEPESDLGNSEDWEMWQHYRDELSKIQTVGNTKGQKTQFLQQMKDKGKQEKKGAGIGQSVG